MSVIVTRRTVDVVHVVVESTKPFVAVRAALESSVPQLDPEIAGLVANGVTDRLMQRLGAAAKLSIFSEFNHGALLGIYGQRRSAVQYLIGNPLTAATMTRYCVAAGLYAPLRVILYETDDGGSRFEYDLPSSLFGQFGDDRITEVAQELDIALSRALSTSAAG
jgi:uncharacterized protein (DUF302 family)